MTDLAATVAMVGHQWVDHLVAAQADDPRLPMALLADPDLIPEPLVRAALAAAIQRIEK